jgi:hypothetical protein
MAKKLEMSSQLNVFDLPIDLLHVIVMTETFMEFSKQIYKEIVNNKNIMSIEKMTDALFHIYFIENHFVQLNLLHQAIIKECLDKCDDFNKLTSETLFILYSTFILGVKSHLLKSNRMPWQTWAEYLMVPKAPIFKNSCSYDLIKDWFPLDEYI